MAHMGRMNSLSKHWQDGLGMESFHQQQNHVQLDLRLMFQCFNLIEQCICNFEESALFGNHP